MTRNALDLIAMLSPPCSSCQFNRKMSKYKSFGAYRYGLTTAPGFNFVSRRAQPRN